MYIEKIEIENIKCFGDGKRGVKLDLTRPDGTCAGWTVLAGLNGSGKSTLLKAISLAAVGEKAALRMQESFLGWLRKGKRSGRVKLVVSPSGQDEFEGGTKSRDKPFGLGLAWESRGEGKEPGGRIIGNTRRARTNPIAESGPWSDNAKGWFLCGYGPFRRLTVHIPSVINLLNGPPRISRLSKLFRDDVSLVESVIWLRELHLLRLEKDKDASGLLKSVIRLLNNGLLPEGTTVKKIDSKGLWVEQGGVLLPLNDLSDGYRTMAALVLDLTRQIFRCYGDLKLTRKKKIVQINQPGVVLVDEMDNHLHVSWQQRIGFWLKTHFPAIQFIVTSHSPFICQAADPNGLIRLSGPGEEPAAERVSEQLYWDVINGSADDAVLTALFGLDRPHTQQAENFRESVAKLESLIIQGKATSAQKKEFTKLSGQLPDTQSIRVEQVLRGLEKRR